MKKIVIVCGLIAGLICTAWAIGSISYYCLSTDKVVDMDKGMIYGYASMILAFSLIFVGIKNYRDKHNGGVVSFGKAFKIGLLISLVASTMYVTVWLIDYFFIIPEGRFEQRFTEHTIEGLKADGASPAVVTEKAAEMADFMKMYRNPFFNALITYCEILPVGLLVSLIAALILKRKKDPKGLQPVTA